MNAHDVRNGMAGGGVLVETLTFKTVTLGKSVNSEDAHWRLEVDGETRHGIQVGSNPTHLSLPDWRKR